MSIGWGLDAPSASNKNNWGWFTDNDRKRFYWFLQYIYDNASVTPIDEIVLLGDIFDNWVFPHDVKPPTFAEIVKAPQSNDIRALLNRLSEKTSVLFLPGNHDMTLSRAELSSVLPKVTFARNGTSDPIYVAGRILGEHGNADALFCAPDPLRPNELPLGYFISRIAATAVRDTGGTSPDLAEVIFELIKLVENKEEVAESVFDAICARAKVPQTAKILMPDDLWGGAEVSVQDVREKYANLFNEFVKRKGVVDAVRAIAAESGDLEPVAALRHIQYGAKLVFMGHTHNETVKPLHEMLYQDATYVNSGCWCNNKELATWIDVTTTDDKFIVSVNSCTRVPKDGTAPTIGTVNAFEVRR
jgi:UDP-2,3-diacylglucosamine pyrophosphatase LpxH